MRFLLLLLLLCKLQQNIIFISVQLCSFSALKRLLHYCCVSPTANTHPEEESEIYHYQSSSIFGKALKADPVIFANYHTLLG